MSEQILTPVLDKQIDIAILILKLLKGNGCTYSEWGFIDKVVNDIISSQKNEICENVVIKGDI